MPSKAIQQIQLGKVLNSEARARETLELMRDAGYDGIELCGFMIRKTPFIVRALTRAAGMPAGRGGALDWRRLIGESELKVVGIHEDLGGIERDPEAIIAEAGDFHTRYIIVTGMYRFDYRSESAVRDLAARLNRAAEALNDAADRLGRDRVSLLYHNHNCEFLKVSPGRTAYNVLLEDTDPELVNFEFDSYWPTEAGLNALELMKRVGSRMKLYHINDRGSRLTGPVMTPILKSDSMELGYGNMDLTALTEQALAAGVDAVILESHKNWADRSPVKSFQLSAEFLNRHISP